MALLDLYMQSGGDDRNAGTDNGSNPTEILGTVSTTSGLTTFTASSGTPFASGVSAGSWVSLYNSGESISRFSGQVQSVTSSTVIVIYNQAASSPNNTALGTVASLTGAVACRVGGAWASLNITNTNGSMNSPSTSAALVGSQYNGLRVNIKASTYTSTSSITLPVGLASKPIWWRGYYATPGDIDNCANVSGSLVAPTGQTAAPSGATRPIISSSVSSGSNIVLNAYNWLENIEFTFTTSTNGGGLSTATQNGYVRLVRCRFGGSGTNANIVQITYNTSVNAIGCCFDCTSGYCNVLYGGANFTAYGCTFRGSAVYGLTMQGNSCTLAYNLFTGSGNLVYINGGSGLLNFINNTFYGSSSGTGNAISIAAAVNYRIDAINNIFHKCSNVISGISNLTIPWSCQLINNDFATVTTMPSLFESYQRGVQYETTPFTNASSNDFSLTSTSVARQAGFPGQFEV